MKKFKISFRPLAEADLFGLYRYIAKETGHEVAGAYIDRIETACMALEMLPERGTRRDDIRPGLRTMGFERRATIAFQVKRAEVVIVRIFYGGQHCERALRGMTGESEARRPEFPAVFGVPLRPPCGRPFDLEIS